MENQKNKTHRILKRFFLKIKNAYEISNVNKITDINEQNDINEIIKFSLHNIDKDKMIFHFHYQKN